MTTAVLREPWAGYAPGTEFSVLRKHLNGGAYLVAPIDLPHRGIVIETKRLEFLPEPERG